MRPLLLALVSLVFAAPVASAQTTGPTGPTVVAPLPPAATTEPATDVGLTAATVRGRVSANGGGTTVQFEYGTSTSYGLTTGTQTLPAGAAAAAVEARLERLTAATTYHYRVVATNAAGITRGADRTFRSASDPSRPTVASEPAGDVTLDAATLSARVDPNRQATTYTFEWGTSTRYGRTTPSASAGNGDRGQRVTARITGLSPDTTYNFRLRATNASGTTTGANRSFRTAKVPLGIRATASPSVVRYTRALTVTGMVTGSGPGGLLVTLERRSFPYTAGFTPFGAPQVTNSSGVVSFVVPPFTLASQFRLVVPSRAGLTSNVATVPVRAFVSLRARALARERVRLTGGVSPANARGSVALQRKGANGRYILVKRLALRPAGGVQRFSTTITRRSASTLFRVSTRLTDGTLIDGSSPTIRLRVRR